MSKQHWSVCGLQTEKSVSVRIDVEALLREREEKEATLAPSPKLSKKDSSPCRSASQRVPEKRVVKKRKHFEAEDGVSPKKHKKNGDINCNDSSASTSTSTPKVVLKVSKPKPEDPFPCCLCVSRDPTGLLRVHSRPRGKSGCQNYNPKDENGRVIWRAHEHCARVVPETWVDEEQDWNGNVERLVFGVDAIVKDRWHLVGQFASLFVARC